MPDSEAQASNSGKAEKLRLGLAFCAAVIATIVPAFVILAAQSHFSEISDLPEYVVAGKMVAAGRGADVYVLPRLVEMRHQLFPQLRERGVTIYSPPPALAAFAPLSLVPLSVVKPVWLVFLSASAVAAFAIIRKIFAPLDLRGSLWAWAAFAISGPLFEALRIGQISPLLLIAFAGACACLKHERYIWAGVLITCFVAKPQEIASFAVYLMGARKYKVVAWAALAGAVQLVVSYFLIGAQGFRNYLTLLASSAENMDWIRPQLAPTIQGQLLRLTGMDTQMAAPVAICALLGALVFCFLLGRRMRSSPGWLAAGVIAAVPVGLVTAPLCHYYDLLLLAPSVMALTASPAGKGLPPWLQMAGIVALMLFMMPFYVIIHYDYLQKGLVINPNFILLSCYALFVSVLVWRRRDLCL